MTYTPEELGFILYNNRSVNGVVSNFLKNKSFNPFRLTSIEQQLDWCKKPFDDGKSVEIPVTDLDVTAEDVTVTPAQLESMGRVVEFAHQALFKSAEFEWLLSRGITKKMMAEWKLGSLSSIVGDNDAMRILGVTCHPVLTRLFNDDLSGGGVLIPLYNKLTGGLVNCTVRRISDVGKLKYSQACPDMDVWGLDRIGGGHIWIVEGLFDMEAVFENSGQAASVSGAMWSGPQLYQLMEIADQISIFADNDQVGLKCAKILQRFLKMQGFEAKTFISSVAKDPAEHFLEKKASWGEVVEINITKEMIDQQKDMVFNFVKYLKNRQF